MLKHVSVSCGVGACALAICTTFALPVVAGELPTGTFTANHTPFTMSIDVSLRYWAIIPSRQM